MDCFLAWIQAIASTLIFAAVVTLGVLANRTRRNVRIVADDHERRLRKLEQGNRASL